MTSEPQAPAGIAESVAALWPDFLADIKAVAGGLSQLDVLILEDLMRTMDRLVAVRAVIDAEGLTAEGSKGQTRPHPLLSVEASLGRDVAAGYQRLHLDPGQRGWTTIGRDGRLKPQR